MVVLDACAVIALLRGEPGGDVVDSQLSDPKNTVVIHAINMCEVFYDLTRTVGKDRANETVNQLVVAGITVREDMDADFWQDAGYMKAVYRRVSLADCFCIAMAHRLSAEIVTCDHREFDTLVEKGACKVRFIR